MATLNDRIFMFLNKNNGQADSGDILASCSGKSKSGRQVVSKQLGELVSHGAISRTRWTAGSGKRGFRYFTNTQDRSSPRFNTNWKYDFEVWWKQEGIINAATFVFDGRVKDLNKEEIAHIFTLFKNQTSEAFKAGMISGDA